MKLMVIWGSSRHGRKGGTVADWVRHNAEQDSRFKLDFVDFQQLILPFFDEPISPFSMQRSGKDYTHTEAKAWAQRVGQAEGIIIVTPEYNHSFTAVLKNALDWVGPEWADKPVGFVGYGGVSGGTRAVEQLRTVTIELGLVQVANPIHFNFFTEAFSEFGEPLRESQNDKLKKMFDDIIRLHEKFTNKAD